MRIKNESCFIRPTFEKILQLKQQSSIFGMGIWQSKEDLEKGDRFSSYFAMLEDRQMVGNIR